MALKELAIVPDTEIWKVEGTFEEQLAVGIFSIYTASDVTYGQVGPIQWQLTLGSPCLKPARGSYVFAVHGDVRQTLYVVNIPDDAEEAVVEALEATLRRYTAFQVSRAFPMESWSSDEEGEAESERGESKTDKIVSGIGKAASYAIQGLAVGASAISKKIMEGGDMLKRKTQPCEEPKPVDEQTKARVQKAKALAKSASNIAGATIGAVAGLTSTVATAIMKSGKDKDGEVAAEEEKKESSAKRVGAAAVLASVEVYEAMELAFRQVAQSAANATTGFVEHKYGKDAGETAYDAMAAAGHTAVAYTSVTKMGRKVAKQVVKDGSKSYAESHGGVGGKELLH